MVREECTGREEASMSDRALRWYLNRHVKRLFAGADRTRCRPSGPSASPRFRRGHTDSAKRVRKAQRPLLLIGSQALLDAPTVRNSPKRCNRLGVPAYLSGMARGLLGAANPLQMRHQRKKALKEADLVIVAGVPFDFRLNYGRDIGRGAYLVAINRSATDARKNRRPDLA